jgi:hypothetical protein
VVVIPYRFRAGFSSAGTWSPPTKYWLKFSSPESTVPHGVTPPEQLLSVPMTVVPSGSAAVRNAAEPAAGPVSRNGDATMVNRRL